MTEETVKAKIEAHQEEFKKATAKLADLQEEAQKLVDLKLRLEGAILTLRDFLPKEEITPKVVEKPAVSEAEVIG